MAVMDDLRFRASEADIAAFNDDGAVCLRGVFEPRWIDLVARGIERNLRRPSPLFSENTAPGEPGRFCSDMSVWPAIPEFREYGFESPAAAVAGQMMRADAVVFLEDQWFLKEPGTLTRTPWHQDLPYYDIDGMFCSVWMPLDPMPRDGGVEFLRGSHRWGRKFMPASFQDETPLGDPNSEGDGSYERMPDIEARREEFDIIGWSLEPGDAIVFDARAVHGAPGNRRGGSRMRRMATRWAKADARYAPKGRVWSGLAEGHGLAPGDPLPCALFPIVWRAPG
jgi:ectoine hydroxylase-related dioxygenase (phytanoyl-CoA dioxygenase family)